MFSSVQFCVQEDDHEGSGIVAHFPAHAGQPLSCMAFDPRYYYNTVGALKSPTNQTDYLTQGDNYYLCLYCCGLLNNVAQGGFNF